LTPEGFGATRPVSTDDALGRAQNRRVELTKLP
jgi:flagellar motor protein MotB